MEGTHSQVGLEPASNFDPYGAAYAANPHPTWRVLRQRGPVVAWPEARALLVTRYEAAARLLDDSRFSLRYADWEDAPPPPAPGEETEFDLLMKHGLFAVPRADHVRLRKLVSPSFTPRAIERQRRRVQAIVDDLLDTMGDADSFDLMRDFAQPLPARVISGMLGVPAEHAELFRRFSAGWIDAISPSLPRDEFEDAIAVFPEAVQMIRTLIEERRRRPQDDLLSELARAEQEGDRLNVREMLSLVGALITAGSETTVHMLAFAVLNLHRHPDQGRLLRRRPALIPNAIYEVLRYDNFGRLGVARFALEDTELYGAPVRKGQLVYPMIGSAQRDPEAFPDPDVFDVTRDQSNNIAFGHGLHYCLGAALARLEGEIALATLLRRFPVLEVDGEPVFEPHHLIRKIGSMRVRVRG